MTGIAEAMLDMRLLNRQGLRGVHFVEIARLADGGRRRMPTRQCFEHGMLMRRILPDEVRVSRISCLAATDRRP